MALALALLLLAPTVASAAASLATIDGLPFCAFAPGIELDPGDPNRALAACELFPGSFRVAIAPGLPLSLSAPAFPLPAGLDCTESGGATPRVANLVVDLPQRSWLLTTNCELAVPFDPTTGSGVSFLYQSVLRDELPTRRTITGSFTTYRDGMSGVPVASFETNLTSGAVRVGNRLLVVTSNFKTAGSNPELYPGTVLLFDIDDSGPTLLIAPAVPPWLTTSDPNPTALTALPGGLVAVTNTGLLDPAFPAFVTGAGSIDVIDPAAGVVLGSIPLGPNPGGRSLALDPSGSVAVATSHTERALFTIDIRGLGALPDPGIDPALQRPSCNDIAGPMAGGLPCLRERAIHGSANPLALDPPPGSSGSAGFVPEVRFGLSGDFLAATSFNDGGLAVLAFDPRNLALPHPLLPSRFGPPETLATAPLPGECCPGPMVLHPNSAGGFAGSHVVWLTAFPAGAVMRGALSGSLPAPGGDYDLDTVEDALDNCPLTWNPPPQLDSGSVGPGPLDEIGDVCQCGDVDGNGIVLASDLAAIRLQLTDPTFPLAFPDKCDVSGDAACGLVDAARITRALAALGPGLLQSCAPANP